MYKLKTIPNDRIGQGLWVKKLNKTSECYVDGGGWKLYHARVFKTYPGFQVVLKHITLRNYYWHGNYE